MSEDTSVYYWTGSLAMAIAVALRDLRDGYTAGAKHVLEHSLEEFMRSPALVSDETRRALKEASR